MPNSPLGPAQYRINGRNARLVVSGLEEGMRPAIGGGVPSSQRAGPVGVVRLDRMDKWSEGGMGKRSEERVRLRRTRLARTRCARGQGSPESMILESED